MRKCNIWSFLLNSFISILVWCFTGVKTPYSLSFYFVNLKGYRSDILNIYKDYSFDVFTSRGEGCPMAMIEALSAGLPMVSFDFKCGPKDLISNNKNGFIIESWNIDDMAACILKLINNKELRCQFAQNADINLKELEISYVLDQWHKIL